MNELVLGLDWSPLWISVKTGLATTFVSFFLGILLAWKMEKKKTKFGAVIESILTLPLVLPPTVAGFLLLLLFSRRRPVGMFLFDNFHIRIVQTWTGCVIAAFVIAFPLMYKNARAAFQQIDRNLVFAGKTLGISNCKIFWKIVIPVSGPGIMAGTILTFARSMGEYGATSMLAGNIAGKTGTISQEIAMVIQDGDYGEAGIWVIIVLVLCFFLIMLMNLIGIPKWKR